MEWDIPANRGGAGVRTPSGFPLVSARDGALKQSNIER